MQHACKRKESHTASPQLHLSRHAAELKLEAVPVSHKGSDSLRDGVTGRATKGQPVTDTSVRAHRLGQREGMHGPYT